MSPRKQDPDQVAPEAVRRRLRSLESLSLKLLEDGPLTDKSRQKLSTALVGVLEGALELDDRESFSQALAAVAPHITRSVFSISDEGKYWDAWWKKLDWLKQEYEKCRRENRTKRQRAACYANALAQAGFCAGSDGATPAVWLPMEVLAAAGLETAGVPQALGMVPFYGSADTLGVGDLNALVDTEYWTRVRKLRLKATAQIRKTTPRPGAIDPEIEALFGDTRLGRTKIPAALNRELLRDVVAEDTRLLAERGARAWDTMRRTAIVQYEGATYYVSTLDPNEPALVAEVPANGGVIQASEGDAMDEALFWVEVMLETGMGVLTTLGVRFPGGQRKLGGWVRKLLDRINANRRLRLALLNWIREVGRVGFSGALLWDLLCLLWDAVDMEFISDLVEDLGDLSHWALLYFLAKLASKATPAGQALLLADVGVLAVELGAKIYRRTEQPRTNA